MRHLIINADGYGFTGGTTAAIAECVDFGTVRSLSVNVNFKHAESLRALVRRYPEISVGCHVNPAVGKPVLPADKVPSLVDDNGEFFYQTFSRRFLRGQIRLSELRAEMMAQIEKVRDLAGKAFSHVDFHMGLHKLPGVYGTFLDVVEECGVGRVRGYRYLVGMESQFPRLRHLVYLCESATRLPKYFWNVWQWSKARSRRLATPDHWVGITNLGLRPNTITLRNYVMMLKNIPHGFNEFVAHPGYVDDDLRQWSTYLDQRVLERNVLLSPEFLDALNSSDIHLAGYRDIPLN
jgi:predicted glycoside hydrolase/deacetylase ChbG (UPF0249 family)